MKFIQDTFWKSRNVIRLWDLTCILGLCWKLCTWRNGNESSNDSASPATSKTTLKFKNKRTCETPGMPVRPLERWKFGQAIGWRANNPKSPELQRESSSRNTPAEEFSRGFSKLIMEGKVRPTTTSRQHNRFQEPLRECSWHPAKETSTKKRKS